MDIRQLVAAPGMPGIRDLRGLLRSVTSLRSVTEPELLDLKEAFEDTTRSWAELLKDLVSFHNSSGGVILFGVADGGQRVGLPNSLSGQFDSANLSNKVARYAPNAHLSVGYFEFDYYGVNYGAIRVRKGTDIVVFDKPGSYPTKDGRHQDTAFHQGVVYVRSAGRCAPARQTNIDRLVERAVQGRMGEVLARIETVATLPLDTDLVVASRQVPDRGYILQSRDEGTPVRLVRESDGEEAVALAEVLDTDAPYSSVQAELNQQVRFWKNSDSNHRATVRAICRWYLRRDEIDIDMDAAEFCMISSGANYGFPMYWASHLSKDRLGTALDREMSPSHHPFRDVAPYLVATFLWNEKDGIFRRYRSELGTHGKNAVSRINKMSRTEYLRSARFRGRTFTVPGVSGRIDMDGLMEDEDRMIEVFDHLMAIERDSGVDGATKMAAHQCDIVIAAPDGPVRSSGSG